MRRTRADRGTGHRGSGHRGAVAVSVACLAGCVTYDVDSESEFDAVAVAQPLAIPLAGPVGDPNASAVDAYYVSIVSQLQDAMLERDPELLGSLLAMHDRDVAPAWARERMAQYRRLVRGLRFEIHAEQESVLEVVGAAPVLGEAVPIRLRLQSSGEAGITVPGRDQADAAARVLVSVVVEDDDCYGGRARREFSEILPIERSVSFDAGDVFELAFGLPALPPEGCHRRLDVTCDLLPGNVLLDGEPLPNQRVRLAERRVEVFPAGFEGLRENPYTHLSQGLERGDPKHFDNVFLAARFISAEFREDAIAKLVHHLRVGREDVGRVCMAALRELTGERISVDDRDGWLAWWQRRVDGGEGR